MAIKINDVYKTPSGRFLQAKLISETGCHHFIEVQDNLNRIPVPEQKDKFGRVIRRTSLVYSEETIATFKKLNPL